VWCGGGLDKQKWKREEAGLWVSMGFLILFCVLERNLTYHLKEDDVVVFY